MAMLRADPARAAPDGASFLAAMSERQARALAELDGTHFDVPDAIRRVDVKAAPDGGAPGAYYLPPSEDFSRPGTVWYSLQGDGALRALGRGQHGLPRGLSRASPPVRDPGVAHGQPLALHRVAYGYSGYAEGWALYVEQLMRELGYYENPSTSSGCSPTR
jgi:uncharacterized protein (DUF885 family)